MWNNYLEEIKYFFIEKLEETAWTILSKPISANYGLDKFWWREHLKDGAEYLLSWAVRQGQQDPAAV